MRARDLEAQIGRQHAPGRQHGGDARHDDPRQIELPRDLGRVQPRGAAKGEQREVPRIDAAPHRDEPHPLGHRRVDDPVDAARRGEPVDPELRSDTVDRGFGGRPVETAPAAEKARRIEIAEHEIGVGDRRGRAAGAIAGGAGDGAGALWADMQDAAGIDPGDRAAAGADAGDVEAVQRDRVAGDPAAGDQGRLAADDQRDVGAGAAHVERDQIAFFRAVARHARCRRCRRPGRTARLRPPAARIRRSARRRHATG